MVHRALEIHGIGEAGWDVWPGLKRHSSLKPPKVRNGDVVSSVS